MRLLKLSGNDGKKKNNNIFLIASRQCLLDRAVRGTTPSQRGLLQPCHLFRPAQDLLAAGKKRATLPQTACFSSSLQYLSLTGSLWKAKSPGRQASRSRSAADFLHNRGLVLWLLRLSVLPASKI